MIKHKLFDVKQQHSKYYQFDKLISNLFFFL